MDQVLIKRIRELAESSVYPALEELIDIMIAEDAKQDSIKRDTEFNTIWDAAYREGGMAKLKVLLDRIHNEAKRYDSQ